MRGLRCGALRCGNTDYESKLLQQHLEQHGAVQECMLQLLLNRRVIFFFNTSEFCLLNLPLGEIVLSG